MEIKNNLEYWRIKAGYETQTELTREAKVPHRLYQKWISDISPEQPGLKNLLKIKKALKKRIPYITLDHLIEEVDPE